jgi:acetyl esterase/lipase
VGDSAGGTLVMSLMDGLAEGQSEQTLQCPGLIVLISPWADLFSPTSSSYRGDDYMSSRRLLKFAELYAGDEKRAREVANHACLSRGRKFDYWLARRPKDGFLIWYGSEEMLAQDIVLLAQSLSLARLPVRIIEGKGLLHDWPVASVFLSSKKTRWNELRKVTHQIAVAIRRTADGLKEPLLEEEAPLLEDILRRSKQIEK